MDQNDIVNLVSRSFDIIGRQDWEEANEFLSSTDLENAESVVIVAKLRSMFPASSKISNYAEYVDNARTALANRGFDSERLLRGLPTNSRL